MAETTNRRSYGHRCSWAGSLCEYRISWCWDKYYPDSTLRFPQSRHTFTDDAGARRFCKRWGVPLPEKLIAEAKKDG